MSDPSAMHGPLLARRSVLGLAFAFCTTTALAGPMAQVPPDGRSVAQAVQNLRAGEFLWEPRASPSGPVLVIVSLEKQKAYVYRNGVLIGISTASTGAPGHATPTGVFTILQKEVDHRSNLYNDAPMPFMQRLTWSGVAMHAGNLPGYPASHGCIRLPLAFAKNLYEVTELGLTVIVTASPDIPRFAPGPQIFEHREPESAMLDPTPGSWHPELARTGPLSIVISAADQRAVVLRNGILIGETPVAVKRPVADTEAYTLSAIDVGGLHWTRIGLFGDERSGEVSAEDRARLSLPEEFRRSLRTILRPGTTVLLTADSLQSGSTGSRLTVITGEEDH